MIRKLSHIYNLTKFEKPNAMKGKLTHIHELTKFDYTNVKFGVSLIAYHLRGKYYGL